jgi:hypothetical protein
MNERPLSDLSALLRGYARDLHQVTPSPSLDARIDRLVAAGVGSRPAAARRSRPRPPRFGWAAAASLAVIAIGAGILIGVRLERLTDLVGAIPEGSTPDLSSADLSMWPSDSVAWTIPAEYSPQGTLVAVNPRAKRTGKRYLIDVVVSNDGTMRIERIVPADDGAIDPSSPHEREERDGVTLQVQ